MDGKKSLVAILHGLLIGASGIIPGASGGILAVAFGIYHPILDAIANLLRQFRKSFLFLLPYGIGVLLGVLVAARALEWLLSSHYIPVMYLLIGLVLGGIPSLIKEAGKPLSGKYLLCILLGAATVAAFTLLESSFRSEGALQLNWFTAMLSGGIIAVGVIIPGISTSFLLMYMGIYQPLLSALNRLDLSILLFTGLGGMLVGLMLIKIVRHVFAAHPAGCSYSILGFLLGTIYLIFPGFAPLGQMALYLLLLCGGFAVTLLLERLK